MSDDNKVTHRYNTTYWAYRPFWTDALQLKEPLPIGRDTSGIGGFLKKYAKEDDTEYYERVKRLAQVNFIDLIIEAYISMLFSTTVQFKSEEFQDEVQAFVSSCNPQGDTLLEYAAEVIAPSALTYGVTDVMVDMPTSPDDIQSKLQEDEAGLEPYCYIIPPLNRVEWELDDAGQYKRFKSADIVNTQIDSATKIKDTSQFTQWTTTTVTIYDKDGNVESEKANPYGIVPAVTVIPRYSLRYHKDKLGISLVQDIVPLQKLVINLISLILDFHESVNFGQRVIVQDTEDGANDPPSEEELSEGGNKRGIVLKGANSKFQIITPDANGVESMRQFLAEIIERIYQSVSMPSDANVNKTHQTQGSIRTNQAVLFNRLSKITKHFEKALKQIIEMALRVQGLDPKKAKVTVQWDRNFSYEAFITALQQLGLMKQTLMDVMPTAVAEYAKSVVAPQLYSSGKMEQIAKEGDDWVKRATDMAQQAAQAQTETIQGVNTEVSAADKVAESEESDT